MTILITGTGTVGCQVTRAAVEKGKEGVVVFDIAPNKDFVESVAGRDIHIEQGSILDLPRLLEIIQEYGVKRIIHTAVVSEACPNIYETINSNIMGTTHVFEAARLCGVERVINCSSANVYDFSTQRPEAPVRETWPISVKDSIPYYSTKIAVEAIARNYAYKFDIDFITFRLAGNFGPSPIYNMGDKRWIYNIIRSAYVDRILKFDSVPTRRIPWTYAKDTADCLVHVAYFDGKAQMPIYNCGYPDLYGLPEMIEALKELLPDLRVDIKEMQDIGWKFPYDVSRLEEYFGFKFRYGPKEAFADFIDWMKSNPQYVS